MLQIRYHFMSPIPKNRRPWARTQRIHGKVFTGTLKWILFWKLSKTFKEQSPKRKFEIKICWIESFKNGGGCRLPTQYDGMTTSLGIVWTQIHCLRRRKPCTSRCSSVSVADITNCATNPTLLHLRFLELTQHSDEHRSLNLTKSDNKIDRHELIFYKRIWPSCWPNSKHQTEQNDRIRK